MSTQTRQPEGVPTGGQFAETTRTEPALTLVPSADLVADFAALGLGMADSTATEHAIATDPTQPVDARRAAARAALDKGAIDSVIYDRWSARDDGDGVAGLATFEAQTDATLDAAMERYAGMELTDGDEHLFGADLAYCLYDEATTAQMNEAMRWASSSSAQVTVTRDDLDAYEPGSYKRAALAEVLGDQDTVRIA